MQSAATIILWILSATAGEAQSLNCGNPPCSTFTSPDRADLKGFTTCGIVHAIGGAPELFVGFVQGVVLDPSNSPIPHASVQLKRSGESRIVQKKTDKSGKFSFRVSSGKYLLFVTCDAFDAVAQPLEVKKGGQKDIKIRLPVGT